MGGLKLNANLEGATATRPMAHWHHASTQIHLVPLIQLAGHCGKVEISPIKFGLFFFFLAEFAVKYAH